MHEWLRRETGATLQTLLSIVRDGQIELVLWPESAHLLVAMLSGYEQAFYQSPSELVLSSRVISRICQAAKFVQP